MMETPREAFIAMLKEWHSLTEESKANDYYTVLLVFAHNLGIDVIGDRSFITAEAGNPESCDKLLVAIEEHIGNLVTSSGIDELFLVRGAVAEMTAYFDNFALGTLSTINIFDKAQKECPDSSSFKAMAELRKSTEYGLDILRCKDAWISVVAKYFNSLSQHFWENDRMFKQQETSK